MSKGVVMDGALFLVAADMEVVVIGAAADEPMELSSACLRSVSGLHYGAATPTIGALRTPLLAIAKSAGKIILWTRSPVKPKMTCASAGSARQSLLVTIQDPLRYSHVGA